MTVTPSLAYCEHGYCETEHCRVCEIMGECESCRRSLSEPPRVRGEAVAVNGLAALTQRTEKEPRAG